MGRFENIKDRINFLVYDYSEKVNVFLNRFIFFVSVIALGLLAYYVGFPLPDSYEAIARPLMDFFLLIFSLEFISRFLFHIKRGHFIRSNIFQTLLSLVIVIELVSHYFFGFSIFQWGTHLLVGNSEKGSYHIIRQFAILLFSITEIFGQSQKVFNFSMRPAVLFLLSFAGLSLVGAVLLTFPEMTTSGKGMNFLDTLFTSTSATCVTGLIVVDTATFFSIKGQLIILILMQLGGIGIITFASFFTVFLRQGIGIRHQLAITDIFGTENFKTSTKLLKQIVLFTFIIESIGAFIIYFQLGDNPSENFYQHPFLRLFYAVFHSVSAFCNAGFSIFSENLMHKSIAHNPFLMMTIALMIVLGGLGFPALRDLFSPSSIRRRKKLKWKKLEINTSIALYSSITLIISGAVLFFLIERNAVLKGMPTPMAIIHSFFQSVTTRTAGFNTIDIATISIPSVFFFLFLMFIGGSSNSTAGGIKTSTFVVIIRSVLAVIRNKPEVDIRRRMLSQSLIYRALAIFAFAVMFQFTGIFLLSLTDPNFPLSDIIFEMVSAFNTVGLSRGITSGLSEYGRAIIILFMFIGRVGSLTFAFAISSEQPSKAYSYPKAHITVG